MRSLSFVAFLLASSLPAQIALPTPVPWPLGCPVPATLANNGVQPLSYMYCTPTVVDLAGQPVTFGLCALAILALPPGETVTTYWNQTDAFGAQVPPGVYVVNGQPYDLGASQLGLAPLGPPHPGATRSIELCATNGADVPYALAASFGSAAGIPLGCGVDLPLDFDWLLVESLTNAAVFPDFVGVLDADGRTQAPAIVLPPLAVLVGIGFDLAFVTLDPGAPCGFGRASSARHVVVE